MSKVGRLVLYSLSLSFFHFHACSGYWALGFYILPRPDLRDFRVLVYLD